MPVIVYKAIDLTVHHAQMRRIQCEDCPTPFTYVTGGKFMTSVRGVPMVSNDRKMQRSALRQAVGKLRSIGLKERAGAGRCPSCNSIPGWMSRKVWFSHIGLGVFLSIFPGMILGLILGEALLGDGEAGAPWGLVLGPVLGAAIGFGLAKWKLHGPKPDPRSMTDSQFLAHLRRCDDEQVDPALCWWFDILGKSEPPEEALVFSLGLLDTLETLSVAEEETTDHILWELAQEAEGRDVLPTGP